MKILIASANSIIISSLVETVLNHYIKNGNGAIPTFVYASSYNGVMKNLFETKDVDYAIISNELPWYDDDNREFNTSVVSNIMDGLYLRDISTKVVPITCGYVFDETKLRRDYENVLHSVNVELKSVDWQKLLTKQLPINF